MNTYLGAFGLASSLAAPPATHTESKLHSDLEASENGHGSIWMVSASEASRTASKATRTHYGLAEWRNNWPSFTAARVLDSINPEHMGTQVLAFRDLTTEPFELREVHVVDGQLQTTKR